MSSKLESFAGYRFNNYYYSNMPVNKNYDIEKIEDNLYKIYMDVVGFKKEEISIFIEEDSLSVEAKSSYDYKKHDLLHKGIASEFCNVFNLPVGFVVEDAYLDSGVLHIVVSIVAKEINNSIRVPIR